MDIDGSRRSFKLASADMQDAARLAMMLDWIAAVPAQTLKPWALMHWRLQTAKPRWMWDWGPPRPA